MVRWRWSPGGAWLKKVEFVFGSLLCVCFVSDYLQHAVHSFRAQLTKAKVKGTRFVVVEAVIWTCFLLRVSYLCHAVSRCWSPHACVLLGLVLMPHDVLHCVSYCMQHLYHFRLLGLHAMAAECACLPQL
jgi:hypothetical protein